MTWERFQNQTKSICVFILLAAMVLMPTASFADDWVAEQLRGRVMVLHDGQWSVLERGDVVADERYIRTMGSGRVTFVRGNEVIEVSGQTQIRIMDSSQRKFTTVMQDYGTISIEAEVEQVQHFSVVTPFLAAVVKGTAFTVSVDEEDAVVDVGRGLVQVRDSMNKVMTNVRPGQKANCGPGKILNVVGRGQKDNMTTLEGEILSEEEFQSLANKASGNNNSNANQNQKTSADDDATNNGNGNGNSGNNGNGNGNSGNNGNGNGNSGNNGNGNGNSGNNGNGNGNSGNNGNGNGNSGDDDDDDDDDNNSGNNGNGNGNSGNNGNGNGGGACNSNGNGIKNCNS